MNDFATLLKNLVMIKNTVFMLDHETALSPISPEKEQAIQKLADAAAEANKVFAAEAK